MTFSKKEVKKFLQDSWVALRPLSLSLAVASTTIGILLAYREGMVFKDEVALDILKIVLIIFGGMLVQSSANLINDFYEGSFKYHRPGEKTFRFLKYERTAFDLFIWLFAIFCVTRTFQPFRRLVFCLLHLTTIQMIEREGQAVWA